MVTSQSTGPFDGFALQPREAGVGCAPDLPSSDATVSQCPNSPDLGRHLPYVAVTDRRVSCVKVSMENAKSRERNGWQTLPFGTPGPGESWVSRRPLAPGSLGAHRIAAILRLLDKIMFAGGHLQNPLAIYFTL